MNIADRLRLQARQLPQKNAVIVCGKKPFQPPQAQCTFEQLDQMVDALAHGLSINGVAPQTRVILMVKPSIEFFAYTFALLRMGAVPVLIDPGMGRTRMAQCLAGVGAEAFVGIPLAHLFKRLYPRAFAKVKLAISVGPRFFGRALSHTQILETGQQHGTFEHQANSQDPAAILFTTGSTGPPKGVCYTHGIFNHQVQYLEQVYGYSPDEIDLPTFPLFALFDAALGMTAILPQMDYTRPGRVDPRQVLGPIEQYKVTHMFGSPALLDRVSRYAVAKGLKALNLRRVMTAGAPVRPLILQQMRQILSDQADIHTPYGATEALPVSTIESREILVSCQEITSRGGGTCVGRPVSGLQVSVIRISDEPIPLWQDDLILSEGTIGEIVVKGPIATRHYDNNPEADSLAKILTADQGHYHRMGDLGYFDSSGRLWFCGRKNHRVTGTFGELYTIPVEARFNRVEGVARTALVGLGIRPNQTPVLCVELLPGFSSHWPAIQTQLICLAQADPRLQVIQVFLRHPGFPVDIRHNSKIFREKLALWASKRVKP